MPGRWRRQRTAPTRQPTSSTSSYHRHPHSSEPPRLSVPAPIEPPESGGFIFCAPQCHHPHPSESPESPLLTAVESSESGESAGVTFRWFRHAWHRISTGVPRDLGIQGLLREQGIVIRAPSSTVSPVDPCYVSMVSACLAPNGPHRMAPIEPPESAGFIICTAQALSTTSIAFCE